MSGTEDWTAEPSRAGTAEPAPAGHAGPDPAVDRAAPRHRWTSRATALLLAGGLVSGALSGVALSGPPSFELPQLAAADIDAATPSVPPTEVGTHIADAKACRVPMAVLTLRPHPGAAGWVRIRSGTYSTPSIRLGKETLRVAIPFPAPYETARGDFTFEASGADYDVFLRPGWVSANRQGPSVVHVWWIPKAPC